MGAVLECCGGPSADDYDTTFHKISPPRYHPLLGRCDEVEKSLLHKLQRSISTSWSTRLMMGDSLKSPHGLSHVSSRYGLDEHYESESDSDEEPSSGGRGAGSVTSATSGSRLLCDFYNLVLECDHSKFFVDANGRRVKGAYLTQVEILEDYFDTTRRTTVGSRRRRRSSLEILPYQPPQKLKHLASNPNYDRSSNMSLMSNDTSQTMASESDYWATFMDKPDDPIDFVTEMTFPPKFTGHQQLTPHSIGRSRRDSADRRRSWVQYEQQLYGSSFDGTTSTSLLLFSPVNANSMNETTTSSSYQRSLSRGTVSTPHDKTVAMPIEGSRYNLWDASIDDDSGMKPVKTTAVPAAFSNATVTERRRASLTMGNTTTNTTNNKRRLSVHSIAPIAV